MVAPLLIAGLVVLGVAAAIAAGVAIAKLIEAGKDADQNFSTCPVGSSTQTCPAKAKTFPTAEAAAIAAMKEANPKSVKEGHEYGGWIRKNSDGTYSYDPPVRGTKDGLTNMPAKGADDVVWYHTHGAADPGYDNENFSGNDGDKGYSKANNATGYLATPSGAIKKYDPNTDTVTTLPDKAPP
jgi:hypothetical protein